MNDQWHTRLQGNSVLTKREAKILSNGNVWQTWEENRRVELCWQRKIGDMVKGQAEGTFVIVAGGMELGLLLFVA